MPTTQWSLIARLQAEDPGKSRAALEELCQVYHYPLYCQIRRHGLSHHDAEDALHEFLTKLLRWDSFGVADPDKGRLRSFLRVALRRFLANWRRQQARWQAHEISRQAQEAIAQAEQRFLQDEAAHHETPDQLYDRQWAQELMNQVMLRLGQHYAQRGKGELFETLRPVLGSGGSLSNHDSTQLAESLRMRPGALRTALNRLLQDYRAELRHAVAQTVDDPELARDEFAALMHAFQFKPPPC